MRGETITAYGKTEDRDKLSVLAKEAGVTHSTWIIDMIRREYARIFGDIDPATLRNNE